MTRLERQASLSTICDCEIRCHGWSEADAAVLRDEVADWWKLDASACEAYLAAAASVAREALNSLFRRPVV